MFPNLASPEFGVGAALRDNASARTAPGMNRMRFGLCQKDSRGDADDAQDGMGALACPDGSQMPRQAESFIAVVAAT